MSSGNDLSYSAGTAFSASTFASGISWGFMTALYSVCMYSLSRNLRSTKDRRKTFLLAAWISLLWILSSLATMIYAYCIIYAYSWQLYYPGGPVAYLAGIWNEPLTVLAYAAYILTVWLADAMLLWRLVIFCHGVDRLTRFSILCFVSLLYVGVVGFGCLILAIYSSGQGLFSPLAKKAAIPCFALSVALDLFATSFISARLLLFRRLLERTLGREQARVSPYTSIAAILVESSALYAVWSLAFIVVFALGDPNRPVLLISLCNVQAIAPILIVYRVSRGVGWERSTSARPIDTHMSFVDPDGLSGIEGILREQTIL